MVQRKRVISNDDDDERSVDTLGPPVKKRRLVRQKRYEPVHQLGNGTFSVVWLAKDRANGGETVALKCFKPSALKDAETDEDGVPQFLLREITLLKKLPVHPNVIRMRDVLIDDEGDADPPRVALVFDYVECSLHECLERNGPLASELRREYLRQLLSALEHCHRHRIIHRDVKSHNVVVAPEHRQLKLIDFGNARPLSTTNIYTPQMTTLWSRAPEMLVDGDYDCKVDVWGAGCVLLEMACGRSAFRADTEIGMLKEIDHFLAHPSAYLLGSLQSDEQALLWRLLEKTPSRRASATEALSHRWLGHIQRKLAT